MVSDLGFPNDATSKALAADVQAVSPCPYVRGCLAISKYRRAFCLYLSLLSLSLALCLPRSLSLSLSPSLSQPLFLYLFATLNVGICRIPTFDPKHYEWYQFWASSRVSGLNKVWSGKRQRLRGLCSFMMSSLLLCLCWGFRMAGKSPIPSGPVSCSICTWAQSMYLEPLYPKP